MGGHRKLLMYIATSLDGYIARDNESLDWLFKTEGKGDNGSGAFFETVDTVLMGRKTYDLILLHRESKSPYKGKQCYVFSRTKTGRTENVEFVNDDIVSFTKTLKSQDGNNIWIIGGGEVLHPLLRENLVDEFIIQVAPTIIGGGLPLFRGIDNELDLALVNVTRYNQFAELHYMIN